MLSLVSLEGTKKIWKSRCMTCLICKCKNHLSKSEWTLSGRWLSSLPLPDQSKGLFPSPDQDLQSFIELFRKLTFFPLEKILTFCISIKSFPNQRTEKAAYQNLLFQLLKTKRNKLRFPPRPKILFHLVATSSTKSQFVCFKVPSY